MFTANVILTLLILIGTCQADRMRIVGGVDIDIRQAPYQVSLQNIMKNKHFCGGSILSHYWILTAGHCMRTQYRPQGKVVVVGMTKKSEGGEIHTIRCVIRHPLFGTVHKFSHDIAVVQLNEPINFNKRARPLRLPTDDQVLPIGEVCKIQGWGRLFDDGKQSDHLQSIGLPLWKPEDCVEAYNYEESLFVGDEAPLICAGWNGSHPDTCKGDSGGPLTYNGIQYGIVSFGMGCANPKYPKVFSHVYNLRDFIYDNTDLVRPDD